MIDDVLLQIYFIKLIIFSLKELSILNVPKTKVF